MRNPLETALAGLAALLIVGASMTSVVVMPPVRPLAPIHDVASMPIIA